MVSISANAVRWCLGAALIAGAGCGGPPPAPARPTAFRVAVSERSVGIPYGPLVLLRTGAQLVAIRVTAASRLGNAIEYEWDLAPAGGTVIVSETHGSASTVESNGFGQVVAGPLRFKWSRGSQDFGWLYWPVGLADIAVCSRTWRNLEGINLEDPDIFWYTKEMFE